MSRIRGIHKSSCRVFVNQSCDCGTTVERTGYSHPLGVIGPDLDAQLMQYYRERLLENNVSNGVALQAAQHPGDPSQINECNIQGYQARGPGIKLDDGKPKPFKHFLLEFPNAINAVAKHAEYSVDDPGHVLYGWKSVPDGFKRYSEAVTRHLIDSPPPYEEVPLALGDLNQHVLAATIVAWNAMARLELLLQSRAAGSAATANSQDPGRMV